MKSNLDLTRIENAASMARAIHIWLSDKSHPEHYADVMNLELIRDFVHTLDLLETVLVRFEISAHLAKLAIEKLEDPAQVGSLGWEFWQIDVEEFFAANLLELCYQISNAWTKIQKFAENEKAFDILSSKAQKPSDIILARHKATHFVPEQFESHRVAQRYSILRRPYRIRGSKLEKELAKYTMPRVAALIQNAVQEGSTYLSKFQQATVG
ncbi:MAG: hypothetical protein GY940_44605 [bacterium]|nr:hypothetical protein [bacterium]